MQKKKAEERKRKVHKEKKILKDSEKITDKKKEKKEAAHSAQKPQGNGFLFLDLSSFFFFWHAYRLRYAQLLRLFPLLLLFLVYIVKNFTQLLPSNICTRYGLEE